MNSLLVLLCLWGNGPEAAAPRQFTWRLSPANLTLPGMTPADFKAQCKLAGEYWSYYANVRITEALPGKPANWVIVTGYKPGAWGTYSGGRITVSTWPPNMRAWAKMSPVQKQQHLRSLIHHEMAHGMGCPSWCQTPTQQRAWLKKRYGPPQPKGVVAPPDVQPLPPVPKRPGLLQRLFQRRTAKE